MIYCLEFSTQKAGSRSRSLPIFLHNSINNASVTNQLIIFVYIVHYRYVDDMLRIGRDDKGNIFILERSTEGNL